MPFTVTVSNLAPTTSKETLHDFFSFCGKIDNIDLKGSEAVITFDKASAAKTAVMLNGGTLDGANINVNSDVPEDHVDDHTTHREGEHHIDQAGSPSVSDKPRAGIAAEYLAKGYLLSDQILNKAIEIDNKQGISTRFLAYIKSLDKQVGERAIGTGQTISGTAQTKLQEAQVQAEQKGYIKQATDYYTRAISSPFGQKVLSFYSTTSKQAIDIHEEARRIADTHRAAAAEQAPTSATTAGEAAPAATAKDKTV
ncbi:hypothetical protein BOTBODRAFT_179937 [Botryobasidium botryosum FD-172 SS1]|uniref:RRM domain-containing protein n=1 Tax=Botryobasidium botryosum (strain FD-172 SS1) TaxID=930990 RepID=A0A067LY41_BOTB1|nr:hypothetical protein BOTBODRAFT_179937 [Botryobasidium botryosum FD-172 SS1]